MRCIFFSSLHGAAIAGLLCLAVGCGDRSPSTDPTDGSPAGGSGESAEAREVLDAMLAAYREATAYADNAVVRSRYVPRQQHLVRTAPSQTASVSFERPNKLRLTRREFDDAGKPIVACYIVSDGNRMRSVIPDFAGQVLEEVAPLAFDAENVITSDDVRRSVLPIPLPDHFPQLDLLVAEKPQADALTADKLKLLKDAAHADRMCQRVEVDTDNGPRTFWIDKETRLLRRLDLPTGAIKRQYDPENKLVSIELWVDFRDARFSESLPAKAFEMELPPDSVRVKRFVTSHPGSPPSAVGQSVGDFEFTHADGTTIDRESLTDKVVVLDFWFTTCGPCRMAMPLLEKVHEKFAENDRVAFLAVSIDGPDIETDRVAKTLAAWGSSSQLVRDVEHRGADEFQIAVTPTVVLLGPEGKIHGYEIGGRDDYTPLGTAIERLLAGEDVAETILNDYQARLRKFETELADAAVDRGKLLVEVSAAKIAPRSEPKKHTLEPLWTVENINRPGNLLVVNTPSEPNDSEASGGRKPAVTPPRPYLLAIDSPKTVVELDLSGNEIARHELDLPEDEVISLLRTAVLSDGQRVFVAAGVGRQQLHVFDDAWNRTLSFPEGSHSGIADVRFADLDGDGQPEMHIGFWGDVGVHGVSLAGKRLWADRSIAQVVQIAANPTGNGREELWCVHSRGTVAPIDGEASRPEIPVKDRAIIGLSIADVDGDGEAERSALAFLDLGKYAVIGLDSDAKEQWAYALPEGEYTNQAERIVAAKLPTGGGWILAAADGSIHLLTKDGELVDRYNHGTAVTGVALTHDRDEPVLVVAGPDGIAAWRVAPKGAE